MKTQPRVLLGIRSRVEIDALLFGPDWRVVEPIRVRLGGEIAARETGLEVGISVGHEVERYTDCRAGLEVPALLEIHRGDFVTVRTGQDIGGEMHPAEFLERRLVRGRPDALLGCRGRLQLLGKIQTIAQVERRAVRRSTADGKTGQIGSEMRIQIHRQQCRTVAAVGLDRESITAGGGVQGLRHRRSSLLCRITGPFVLSVFGPSDPPHYTASVQSCRVTRAPDPLERQLSTLTLKRAALHGYTPSRAKRAIHP